MAIIGLYHRARKRSARTALCREGFGCRGVNVASRPIAAGLARGANRSTAEQAKDRQVNVVNTLAQLQGSEMTQLGLPNDWETAMTGYADELKALVAGYPAAKLLELGAGRWPSFRLDEMPGTIESYTVNDISEHELSLLPEGYEKACFDVSGDAANFSDSYDVVFSRSWPSTCPMAWPCTATCTRC
jgi:hypothetical protein